MVRLKDTPDKITVAEFMDISDNNTLELLVIEGEPTVQELQATWGNLLSEYYKATCDERMGEYVRQLSRFDALKYRVESVSEILGNVRRVVAESLALPYYDRVFETLTPLFDTLRELDFDRPYTTKTINADLNWVEAAMNNDIMAMRKIQVAIEGMDKGVVEGVKRTVTEVIIEQLDELRIFDKYDKPSELLAKEMPLSAYCRSLNRLQKHNEKIQNQNKEHVR
jgi:hypothetical protein